MTKKSESCEVEEITMNSPPWPPLASLGQTYRDEERSFGSSEWVDTVMVNNMQDEMRRVESHWGEGTTYDGISILLEDFYRRDLYSETSRIFSKHSYNIFMGNNNNNTDELEAGTIESSEPDLLWQYNQSSKISSTIGTTESKPKKPASKPIGMYGSPIYSSLSAPASDGVDIKAKQRMERYIRCFVELEKVKACLPSLSRRGGLVAKYVLELNLAFQEILS